MPRSREALSPVSSNRPDLRGIHAVFCLSFHPSCRLVASGRQSRWLLRRARLHTKMQKETRQTGCLLRLFISSARRKETPCHFIHSSPVNLSVLLNILHSFRNDRAHYTLCFRRSSLTYSALTYFALTYFAQGMLRGKQIFPAQCTARLLIQGYCSRAFEGCIVGVFP